MLTPIQLVDDTRSSINECDNPTLCIAIDNKQLIIDVREPAEHSLGFIANAVNIPRGLLEFAILEHPLIKPNLNQNDITSTPIFLYCKSGGRSALAAKSLETMGFTNIKSLQGGVMSWESAGFKINKDNNFEY